MVLEDDIREKVKISEQRVFDIRANLLKYYSLRAGKLQPDKRYLDKISDLEQEEEKLTKFINLATARLMEAAALASKFPGQDHDHPLTWLQNRLRLLTRDIEIYQSNLISDRQTIEKHENSAEISGRSEAWKKELKNRIRDNEARLKQAKLEREKVEKIYHEVEGILQGAV